MTWLTGWNRRKPKLIRGSTAGGQTNYQLKLTIHKSYGIDTDDTVYLGGYVNNDFSDLRFTSSDETTLLPYWIESYISGVSAIVWIKIDSIPADPFSKTIYVYYDNPVATTVSNGTNTFIFFDDFPGSSLDPTKWTSGSFQSTPYGTGSVVVSNSIATLTGATSTWWGMFANGAVFAYPPFTVEFLYKGTVGNMAGVETTGTLNPAPKDAAGFDFSAAKYISCNDNICNAEGTLSPASSYELLRIDVYAGGIKYYINRSLTYTKTTNVPNEGMKAFIAAAQPSGIAYTDWVFIRKYASPEPTFSISGLEEMSGAPTCPTSLKYEGDTVHLSAIPKDGIGPYTVIFKKNDSPISSLSNVVENTEVTYDYILTNEDIRTASTGTIDFSVYIEDSCPITHQTCIQLCTIDIGCMAPVCNFTVT